MRKTAVFQLQDREKGNGGTGMLRIVAADDEFLVTEGIRIMLKEINVENELADIAFDGDSAWAAVTKNQPDLLLTDIRMPGMDGLELIRRCREEYPDLLVIVISGYQDFVYAQKAIELGVIGYIDKPITPEKLEQSLRKAEDIVYRRKLDRAKDPHILKEFDSLFSALYEGSTEKMRASYEQVKGKMHEENLELDEYSRRMFVLITSIAGSYYELSKRALSDKHLPSYRNMTLFTTFSEVDQYADTIIESIIEKLKIENQGIVHDSIRNIVAYIDRHFREDVSLNRLAEMAQMNPVYLSTLFKQETGTSYVKYLTALRIEKAKQFLLDGYRVNEVCEMVGYPNYRYFCDLFKKHTGITPNEYKGTVRKH